MHSTNDNHFCNLHKPTHKGIRRVKIFGIGLSKTGTTSLAAALKILGFKTKDYPGLVHYIPGDLTSLDASVLEEYDALTDTPIPSLYQELDAKYPDAKFILTIRDREGWLKSCKKQFTRKLADKQNEAHNQLFMDLYGSIVFDEEKFSKGYENYVEAVKRHFKDRPEKLLIMDVANGDGWEKLCPFLNKEQPGIPFPKANVTRVRWMKVEDLVDIAKAAGDALCEIHSIMVANVGCQRKQSTLLRTLTNWCEKTYIELRGGRDYAVNRASHAANKLLVSRLHRLNPDIPIISRFAEVTPYQQRGKWNHFWLVDPLDGTDGFARTAGDFSVNIALIEDRKPIYGVVHAPLSGTTYYAVAGKGGFKSAAGVQPKSLGVVNAHGSNGKYIKPASNALKLCMLAEGETGIEPRMTESMEWHSAAAQVVAQACGKHVVTCYSQDELIYNKADLQNNCITMK
jgi:3'-phosphoadenosine 5'-phosphosulfate (PAPS) 3'-phosphatase